MADTKQQMKARIAERLGVSIDEVPDSAIEKEMEESGALAKLKNQAKLTGVNPAETPLVQIPGLAEISAPKAPASPEKSVQAAISKAAAPTKSPEEAIKKVDEVVDEQAKFKQLQKMYASMSPIGNLSEKQVSAITEKYDEESGKIAAELAKAKQDYAEGRNRIENAALIDSLGKGLAQLMAGLYGVSTGRDAVTGVDFKPKDWSNSFALLQRDYAQRAAELKDARRESESAKEKELSFAERQAARTAQASETASRLALQDIRQEAAQAAMETRAEQKEAAKQKAAQDKLVANARAEIERLKQVLRTGDSKSRKKQEEVTAEALGKAGISSTKTAAVLEDYRGGIFSKAKPELLDTLLEDVSPAAAAPSGTVTVIDKVTGKSKQFPANSNEVINARKNPRFEVK